MIAATRKARLIMELRAMGITDRRVLGAIEKVPRERFVPDFFREQAYDNTALPISCGQTISQPYVVALMTEALELTPQTKVLEIGTGCGYQTAVLARLARRVYSIERHRDLTRDAEARLAELDVRNVTLTTGDGYEGWPVQAPFGAIIVTCAAPELPHKLVEQLDEGGVMVLPVGGSDVQEIVRVRRTADGLERDFLGLVRFVPFIRGVPENGEDASMNAKGGAA